MGKLELRVLCYNCGVLFTVLSDTPNLLKQCQRCYNKSMEDSICYYCDEKAKYTQPGKTTGKIIDVCEKHFSFKHWG